MMKTSTNTRTNVNFNSPFIMDRLNEHLMKRRCSVFWPIIPEKSENIEARNSTIEAVLATANAELMRMGYIITPDDNNFIINEYNGASEKTLADIGRALKSIVETVRKITGDDKVYIPMYPGFPYEVMEMSDDELLFNAVIHYMTDGIFQPRDAERLSYLVAEKEKRSSDFETIIKNSLNSLKRISLVKSLTEIDDMFINISTSPVSLSDDDKRFIAFYIEHLYVPMVLPEMPFKENAMFVLGQLSKNNKINFVEVEKNLKTATDILRFYVALSGGDVSLSKKTRFVNLKNREYRFLMNALNNLCQKNIYNVIDDMWRYPEIWKRVGEKIHPGKYINIYTGAVRAFSSIRNGKRPESFNSQVEKLINNGQIIAAANELKTRPGMLGRSLDRLLSKLSNSSIEEKREVLSIYRDIIEDLPSLMLYQITDHFKDRMENKPMRDFIIKGDISKVFSIENTMTPIDSSICKDIIRINSLVLKMRNMGKPYIGGIYIDPSFEGYIVPFSQRSASDSMRPCTRGSKWKLKPDTNILRSFCWWTNYNDDTGCEIRVDEDLSAIFIDSLDKPKVIEYVNYTNMRLRDSDNNYICIHSGDIVNGGPEDGLGSTEFVDVNINKAVTAGYRYCIITVHSFTSMPFEKFNSRAGYMEMTDNDIVDQKSIFIPEKVEMNMDINSESTSVIPVVIDLVDREVYWVDMTADVQGATRNINSTHSTIRNAVRSVLMRNRTSMADIIRYNTPARGIIVDTAEEADLICTDQPDKYPTDKKILTPFMLDEFTGKFM